MNQFMLYLAVMFTWFAIAKSGGCAVEGGRFKTTIRQEGLYESVQGPYDFWECGYGDTWVSSFTAKRPTPEGTLSVSGTMCCGMMKGCTIRWQ